MSQRRQYHARNTKIPCESMVSGAGEFHPRALSEPDMHVSAHPAPISRTRYGLTPKRQCGNKSGSRLAMQRNQCVARR